MKSYKRANEIYKKLDYWMGETPVMPGYFFYGHLEYKFRPLFNKMLDEKHKELFPRRKKINHNNVPEDEVNKIREIIRQKADRYVAHKAKQYVLLENWLYANAPNVELKAKKQIVYKCDFGTYSTQTNKWGYTKANCDRIAKHIRDKGIDCEVVLWYYDENYERIFYSYAKDPQLVVNEEGVIVKKPRKEHGFCIVAELEPYMVDAILRMTKQTELEWAISCWKTGTNPKVMNPFLDDKIYEESLRKWRE